MTSHQDEVNEAVEAQVVYQHLAEEATDAAFHETDTAPDEGYTGHELRLLVAAAGGVKDKTSRDLSLISALRSCRDVLQEAKRASDAAAKRVEEIKSVYDLATRVLAGYTPYEERQQAKEKSQSDNEPQIKRAKVDVESNNTEENGSAGSVAIKTPKSRKAPTEPVPLPTNPIIMPTPVDPTNNAFPNIPPDLIITHKEAFYQKLLNCSVAELSSYTPSPNSANLKSKAQLAEWIYIAQNWNTGADGLDAGAFRAKYKTWYSRMKPVSVNLGRRTGIHLRHIPNEEGVHALTVLCRHSKDGSKSLPYLPIDMLFDALFEIHCVELGHRGRDATKSVADERYANIPDAQVRYFIDTCPFCLTKKRGGGLD